MNTTTALLTRPPSANGFLRTGTVGQTLVAAFDSREAAAQAALDLVAITAALSLELLDRAAVRAVSRFADIEVGWDGAAVLVVGLEAGSDSDRVAELCTRRGASDVRSWSDAASVQAAGTVVRAAHLALAIAGAGLDQDVTVAVSTLPRVLAGLTAVEARFGVSIGLIAYVGHGIVAPFVIGEGANADAGRAALAAFALSIELSHFAA